MTEMDLGPVRGPEQPDNTPTAKVTAGTLAGAFTAVIISITEYFGVNLPPVATVISNGPVWAPAPVYYPAPVTYAPPVVYEAPAVVYPVYGTRRPIVYAPPYVERPYHRHHWRGYRDRDVRWAPGYRGERRYPHGEHRDYRR